MLTLRGKCRRPGCPLHNIVTRRRDVWPQYCVEKEECCQRRKRNEKKTVDSIRGAAARHLPVRRLILRDGYPSFHGVPTINTIITEYRRAGGRAGQYDAPTYKSREVSQTLFLVAPLRQRRVVLSRLCVAFQSTEPVSESWASDDAYYPTTRFPLSPSHLY